MATAQPPGPDRGAESLGWLVRVSRPAVALRTLWLWLTLCALLALPFVLHYRSEVGRVLDRTKGLEGAVIDLIAQTIAQEVEVALSHLRYLSQQNELREYLQDDGPAQADRLAREHLAFLAQTRHYDQVRVIDVHGRERIRVNFNDGRPAIVPPAGLQDKGERYYFTDTMTLGRGEVYVSPFDLNVERDAIEQPTRPVIRLGVPLFDQGGARRGILLLNYLGGHMLDKARAIARTGRGQLWLLNEVGYWLVGPSPEDEWAFMYPERGDRSLAARDPAAWEWISRQPLGEVSTPQAWIRFKRVYPLAMDYPDARREGLAVPPAPQVRYWTVASVLPTEVLQEASGPVARELAASFGGLAFLCLALAFALAYASLRGRALARAMARVVNHVPDLIAYVDADQRYRFNNQAYERFFGLSPAAIYGKTVREVVGEAAYASIREGIERALAGEEVSFEARLEYSRRGLRDVSVSYIPDVGTGGAVEGFVAFVRDLTPLKEAERRERHRMLEVAHVTRVNSLGQMATEIAHEVSQPLAAIGAYSSACLNVLKGDDHLSPDLGEWLLAIRSEAERVSHVVRRLREFMRKGGGERVHADVNDLVSEALRMVEWEARSRGARLQVILGTGVPPVTVDRILIEQVLLNLLRNALDAVASMPADRRQVTVETRREAEAVRLSVADSGPGIDPQVRSSLFEPFVTTKSDGLGMGLAISRSIIEAHGGRIDHGSAPQGGAMFTLTLPVPAE